MLGALERVLALRAAPLFAALPTRDLLPVANLCTELSLESGEPLFHEGELGDAVYVLASGRVAVERDSAVVATLGAGECVGELAVLDWHPRSATVTAVEPSRLIRLDRHDLLDLIGDYPQIADNLASVLVERVRNTVG